MRIAVVTEFYYPTLGGIQEHVFHFTRQARRLGHEVTIITGAVRDLPPATPEAEAGVIRLGRSLAVISNRSVGRVTFGVTLGRQLDRLLTRDRFDVVHCHAPLSPVLPLIAPRHTALPVVGTLHTNFPKSRTMDFFRNQLQWIVDRLDARIAVSNACVRASGPYVNGNFRIIPNGVDCEMWARGQRLAGSSARQRALFIGRLEGRCGLDRILRAWTLLPKRVDAALTVIGDGPDRASFEALADQLQVPAQFLGAVRAERPDHFASADIMLCPTTIASFGITLLEGMAAGLPIIASDIQGFQEILTHEREGVLIDTADPQLFARHITEFFDSASLCKRYGAAGRATAATYDWPVVTRKILDVYEEVAA